MLTFEIEKYTIEAAHCGNDGLESASSYKVINIQFLLMLFLDSIYEFLDLNLRFISFF